MVIKNFIIIAGRRSGVSLIVSCLDSHPLINCTKNVFSTKRKFRYFRIDRHDGLFYKFRSISKKRKFDYFFHRKQFIKTFLSKVYLPCDDKVKATGIRVSYGQAKKYPVILDWVKENNASVIHLIRKNPVKAIVSHFTAKKRRMYHTTSKVNKVTISLSPRKLRREVAKRLYEIEKYRQIFKHQNYHELNYESFIEDRDGETFRILDFLGIDEFVSLQSNLVKQNPDSLDDILENFQEIKKALKGSKFEKYLVM